MEKGEKDEINHSLKLLAGASFIVLITTILSKLLTYLYRIVIARQYTPEIYGIYSISLMIVGWITVFVGLGFSGGLTRYIPYFRGKKEGYKSFYIVKKTTYFLLFSGAIGCIILLLLSSFISNYIFHIPELEPFLLIFSFAIPLSVLAGVYFSILKSYEKIGWFTFIVNILQNSIKLLTLVFLIYIGFNSTSIAISYVTGIAVALIVAYFVARKKIPSLFVNQETKDGKEVMSSLLAYSWPLMFYGIIASIFSWTDTFMIGVLRTTAEVGFYNVAVPTAVIITLSTDLFRQMLLPIISKEYGKGNMVAVREISRQVTKWLFIAGIPLFAILFIFPEEVIRILFGAEYSPAAKALRILAVGYFVTSILDVSQEVLSMKGMSKLVLVDTIILAVIDAILNYLLIPTYGINGAAISTTISLATLSILFTYQAWRYSSVSIIKPGVSKVVISGIISFALLFASSVYFGNNLNGLIIGIILFTLSYAILLYITCSIDSNDYMILKAAKNKFIGVSYTKPVID